MKWLKMFLGMIIFVIVLLFAFENTEEVTLRFGVPLMQDLEDFSLPNVPLFLAILCSVLLGILIGVFTDFYRRFQLKRTLRQSRKTIERLEKEMAALRGELLDRSESEKTILHPS